MSLFILDDMIIDESGGDSQENKRVKITTACDTCRRRKVKCDGESPCANCQRGSYQCTFSDATAKRPRGPPKGFVALIEDRLHTIESLLVNLVNKDNVSDLSNLTKDVKQYSDVLQKHPGYADEVTNEDDEILQNNLVHPNVSNTLQSNTLSFLTLDDQNSNDVLSEHPLPKSTFNLKPIPEEISKQLFEKYFNNFHPYFPIINRGNFFRLLNNANVENQPSKLLIEAICAVGAMFPPMVKENTEYNSQFFYERAKNLLDRFTDVPRLSTIQALLLLCFLDQGKPSSYRSQTYSSIAIRMAQSIGLNRKNGAAYQGAKDRQSKKLAWWGCFVLDRINSLNTGDPLIINDKICDIELPSADDMEEDNNEYAQQIDVFIQFIRITKITGQILDHLQSNSCGGLQASSNHHAIIDIFESLLSDWLRELPPYFNYSPLTQHLSFPGQIANLHMQHQTLYMLLYYPYIAEYEKSRERNIRTSKNFAKSVNACSAAASKITNIGVEALNNITTCVTFPAMFYCLGKAAKVHSINILSPQRGLAINSYKNIIKTVKVCKFYKQHNIMKELAQKTISLLENILIKYQDKFSHEEIFGITPTGEIVNPDGLDLTLSSFGISASNIGSSSSNPSLMTSPPRIKVTPPNPNQMYSDSFDNTNNNAKSVNTVQSILLPTSPNVDVSLQKRNDSSNQIQQTNSNFNFIQNDNERNQQFPTGTLLDSLMLQTNSLTPSVVTASPTNEQHFWDIVSGGFNDNPSYDTNSISTSSAQTPSMSPSQNYFSPQRAQSLPTSTSSQEQYNSNHFRSQSFSSHTHSNQMFDSIDQDIHTSPNSSPTLQQSQSNSASPNDTTSNYNIFFDNNLLTTSPTSSRSRMTSPCPSSSSELEIQNNAFANGLYFGASDELNNESAINLLSKRVGNCGVKSPSNVDTPPVGIKYNQFDMINEFRDFENGGI